MSARSLNKVQLIGNLTRDPNLRFTPNGAAVCSFGIATNRTWTPADGGEKQERAEFHNIVAWSKLAEICGQLLGKGDKVYVEGRLQTREWKGEDNQDRRTTEVVIDNMILLRSQTGKSSGEGSDPSEAPEEMDDFSDEKGTKSKKASKADKADEDSSSEDEMPEEDDVSDDVPF